MSVPVIVLAGGKAKPELQAVIGVDNRALAMVDGKTLISRVTSAIHDSDRKMRILVIGDLPIQPGCEMLADAGDFVSNVLAGAEYFAEFRYVLFVTADLPYLSGAVLSEFIDNALGEAESTGAVLVYPVVPVQLCYDKFPGIKRTALKLSEGVLTGGNIMLARPGELVARRQTISKVYLARKSLLNLGAMLGAGTVLRILLAQTLSPKLLTVEYLEKQVARLLRCSVSAILSNQPELATDLDRPEDFLSLR